MPITGTFEADFSQFLTATQGAQKELLVFSKTSTDTAVALTGLEKTTTTHAGSVGTLRSAYQSFDGVLNSVGVHIGPQISALEDLGKAAGKTASDLGLVGSAGLVLGTAMAAWDVGRWVANITGADQAIVNFADKLMGTGLAAQTAGAVQDSIDLAFQRTGVHATSAAEALALNTKWAKENNAAAKENAASAKAAADSHDKWEAAVQAVTAAGKGYKAILDDIDPAIVTMAKHALENKAHQEDVATAYKLTGTQVQAVVQLIAAQKKEFDEAAAKQREYDAELMTSYGTQIKVIEDVEKARANHYGLDEQIRRLDDMAKAEDAVTAGVVAELNSEKDKLKIEEANYKRHVEIENDKAKLREQQTTLIAESTLRAIGLQTQLNKAYGLDAKGAILLPQDAMTEYQKKIDSINRTMQDGAEKTAALALANKQLEDSFLADAKAADVATVAVQKSSAAADTAAQTAAKRANASFGGGTIDASAITGGNTSADVVAYMSQGYTLGEALLIAMGQGAQIIGKSSSQLNKISGGGFRAAGGPVAAGVSYVVGERGPELFTPDAAGAISPTVGGRGGVTIVVQGSVLSTQTELAALVERAMVEAYRRGGNRLPV